MREQALRLVGSRWAESTALRDALLAFSDDRAVLAFSDDRNGAIRFRLALVLGGGDPRQVVPVLVWLDRPTPGQVGFLVQVGQSIGGQEGIGQEAATSTLDLVLAGEVVLADEPVLADAPGHIAPGAVTVVAGVVRGMADQGHSFSATLRKSVSGGQPGWFALAKALPAVRHLALDPNQAVEFRLAAVEILGVADTAEHGRELMSLLEPDVPQPLQSAATAADAAH